MTKTLKWIKFESIMTAIFLADGRGLSKFNTMRHKSIDGEQLGTAS